MLFVLVPASQSVNKRAESLNVLCVCFREKKKHMSKTHATHLALLQPAFLVEFCSCMGGEARGSFRSQFQAGLGVAELGVSTKSGKTQPSHEPLEMDNVLISPNPFNTPSKVEYIDFPAM